jgi:hypothetical protein
MNFYRQSDLDRYENRKYARAAFTVLMLVLLSGVMG